jgi:hypothetical protein
MISVFSNARAYRDFKKSVINGYERILDDVAAAFLDAVDAALPFRLVEMEEGFVVVRARLGCEWSPESEDTLVAIPFDEGGMKPTSKVPAGRANSAWKPVFYAATDDKTAVAETRPWVGALVSVASFRLVKELRIVNCADPSKGPTWGRLLEASRGKNLTQDEIDAIVWNDVGKAFAEPVTPADDPTAYVPTQILAELFKRHPADGVAYRSSVGEGCNIAIFDLGAVKLHCARVVRVRKLSIEIEEGPFY